MAPGSAPCLGTARCEGGAPAGSRLPTHPYTSLPSSQSFMLPSGSLGCSPVTATNHATCATPRGAFPPAAATTGPGRAAGTSPCPCDPVTYLGVTPRKESCLHVEALGTTDGDRWSTDQRSHSLCCNSPLHWGVVAGHQPSRSMASCVVNRRNCCLLSSVFAGAHSRVCCWHDGGSQATPCVVGSAVDCLQVL